MSFAKAFCALNTKYFPSRQVFEKKGREGREAPKNSVFEHFCKIVELNTQKLTIDLCSLK